MGMQCKSTHFYNILQGNWQKISRRAFLRDGEQDFMSSSEAVVDAVIEVEEGFSAVLEAAWDDGGAKEDAAVWAAVDAIAKGEDGCWGFLEEGHLAMEVLAIHYIYMVCARGNSVVGMFCCVANVFTIDGEPAVGGRLPYVVAVQKDVHVES